MRGSPVDQHFVKAWQGAGVLLEHYRYAPGPAAELPTHSHEEYQLCYSADFPGEYTYRGERHDVPVGSLSVIYPGEAHSARDPEDRLRPATFKMMYVAPSMFERVAEEVAGRQDGSSGRAVGLPSFGRPIILDEKLAQVFMRLHEVSELRESKLEQESRLLSFLSALLERHAGTPFSPKPVGREHRAVRAVREYIEDKYADNVSLQELSAIANLSPYHLSRVFAKEVGMPPYAYLVAVRVHRGKDLLLRGWPISRVAQEVGFADQSHFSNYFKRFVGAPPGSYVRNSLTENRSAKNRSAKNRKIFQ